MIRQNFGTRFVAAFLAAIVLLYVLTPSLEAQTTQILYMPVLQATASGDIGLALSNPTLSTATVTLTARDYTGTAISGNGITNPATMTLPPSGQLALRAVEIFGTGITGKVGWVELLSSSVAVKGFFLVFDSRISFIDGAELQTQPASRLVFPKVSGNPASPTMISYVNTGTNTLRFSALTFFDNSGRRVASTYLTLAPKSGFAGSILDALPDAAGLEGYAVLETTGTPFSGAVPVLVGFETYRNLVDVAALNAVPDTAISRISYLPHFASGSGYSTRLSLVNVANESQTLTITAASIQKDGVDQTQSTAVATRTIPPHGRLEETASSLFSFTGPSLYTGYIKWEAQGSTAGVIGYLDYGTTDGVLLSAVPAQSTSYSDLFFSHIAQGLGYYTGIAFLNANTQTSVVSIDGFNSSGSKIASTTMTLAAGQRVSKLFTELFPALGTQLGGYVRVSASRPVFAFELFGSSTSLSFLADVSAQGVQLQPQASGSVVTAAAGANVISTSANASISIPPGALSSDTAVTLNSVTVALPPPSSTSQIVASLNAEPTGTIFNIPVRLTFPLSAQLPPGTQLPLLVYTSQGTYSSSDNFIAIVDDSGRTASAQVTHFTTFALGLSNDQIISVTSISPSIGQSGATVTIGGSGFSTTPSNNIVRFAGADNTSVPATVTASTATSLTLTVPANAITGNVIVTVGTKTSTGILFSVPGNRPTPSLSSILPNSLPAGTTTAEIKVMGTGFVNASLVRLDGTQVATTFVTTSLLLADLTGAQLAPGVHKITVFTPTETGGTGGGESGSVELTIGFPKPAITSISPTTAESANGPVTVTITGTGFTSSSKVTVSGAVDGSGTFVNSTTMTVVLNSDKAGDLTIAVLNPSPAGGTSETVIFSFSEPPVGAINLLSAANPTGTVGTTVTMQVEIRKKNGSLLPGFPVTFSISAGNGSVTPASVNSDGQGHASATLMLGTTVGTNTVRVTSGSITVFFSATGTAGPAAKVGLSASPTSIQAGGAGTTITAQVQDQYGNLRNDAVNGITFSVTAGSGNLTASLVTAVAGVATTTLTSTNAGTTTVQGAATGLTSGTTNVTVTPGAPASMAATGGTGQNGQAGVALATPLKVQIKDAFSNVVPGVTVTFSVVSGGGSVNPVSGTTNANGEVSTTATAGGPVGTQTFRAASAGLTNVDFNATIAPGTAAKLALSTGGVTTLVAGTTATLTVTIQDAFGNTATAANNTITINSNIAGSPIGTIVGPAGGVATSTFSGQLVGNYTLTASSTGLTGATANISVTVGPAAVLAYVSGDGQTAVKGNQLPALLVAKSTDAFGNVVSGVQVTFASTNGGGSVGTANATTGTNGQASSTATLGGVTGINLFTATAAGLAGSPITFTATATNAAPVFVVQIGAIPSSATVNTTQTLTVEVRAADNTTVIPGVAVAFSKTVGNGSVSANSAITDGNGRAAVTLTLGTTAGTNTYTAIVSGLTPVTVTITGNADVAASLNKISGDTPTQTGNTGTALANPFVVEVRDQYGNVVAGTPVTVAASSGTGTVSPAGSQNSAANGRVSVTATLGPQVGTQTFTATSGALTPVIFSATVNQAAATQMAQFGSVAITTVGSSATFTVVTKDASGNVVPGVTVNFAKTVGGGSVSPASGVTGANGQTSTTITLGTLVGTNTFTATSGSLAGSPVSLSITGTADAAAVLAYVSGDSQTGAVGTAVANPLVVEARDVYGNVKSGVAVTFTATSGNGSVNPTGAQNTLTNGRAQVTATLGAAVTVYQFTASAPGLAPVVFSETGTLIPATITKTAGDNQTVGVVGAGNTVITLDTLKVHVVNAGGIAIPNATINWAAASGGGAVSATTSLTNVNGDATITATASTTAATNTFTATVNGTGLSVTFTTAVRVLTSTPGAIDVQIASGTTVIGSYDVTINFDPTKVRIACDDGTLICTQSASITGGSASQYNSFTTTRVDNVTGLVQLNQFQTNQTAPKGNFTVAHVVFTPIRTGSVTLSTSGVVVTDNLSNGLSTSLLSLSATGLTIN